MKKRTKSCKQKERMYTDKVVWNSLKIDDVVNWTNVPIQLGLINPQLMSTIPIYISQHLLSIAQHLTDSHT